jgi:hypothetical protein
LVTAGAAVGEPDGGMVEDEVFELFGDELELVGLA